MAHIYALAGVAGVNHDYKPAHDYGVDGQFDPVVVRGKRRVVSGHPIAFQAKATTDWELDGSEIVYDLEAKTYDDLVTRHPSEVTMPKDPTSWHNVLPETTELKHYCYWAILSGPPCGNTQTKRIRIPVSQVLTPSSLLDLLAAERRRRQSQWL